MRNKKESKPLHEGQRFGSLTVIGLDHVERKYRKNGTIRNRYMYLCQCDCGRKVVLHKVDLLSGKTTSCGCYRQSEYFRAKMNKIIKSRLGVMIEYNGEIKCLTEWAKITGLSRRTLVNRLRHGWSIENAITTPARHYNRREVLNDDERTN